MKKIVVASNNQGKINEFKKIFPSDYLVLLLKDVGVDLEVEETGSTFFENALLKAKTYSTALHADVISDDSGLVCEALDGAPGIFSARYSGENADSASNKALLLKNLQGKTNRNAKFVCCIVYYKTDGTFVTATGETFGEILTEEQGQNGFGYDALFFSHDLNKCFGNATEQEKNSVSHRARAISQLITKL